MRRIIWFLIILFLLILIGSIALKYFFNLGEFSIKVVKSQPTETSYGEYKDTAYRDMVQFYNSSEKEFYFKHLSPRSNGVTLELLQQKGIDITEDNRICFIGLYGSILPDESKFVFAIDSVTKKPESPVPPCDSNYDSRYGFYIFDTATKDIISLPQNSIPILWIDKDNLLYEKTTSNPLITKRQDLRTNFYLYNIVEDKHSKLSSYDFSYGRKDIDDFAISPNKDKMFIEDPSPIGTMDNFYNYLIIPLKENQEELSLEIKECSKIPISNPRNPVVVSSIPCGKFTWSKDGKSILYLYQTNYDINKSFRIINIY